MRPYSVMCKSQNSLSTINRFNNTYSIFTTYMFSFTKNKKNLYNMSAITGKTNVCSSKFYSNSFTYSYTNARKRR